MPIDPVTGAFIAYGLGSAINAGMGIWGQHTANEQNERLAAQQQAWNRENMALQNTFNVDMYSKQKEHAIDMWNRQNQYNSPIEQMARLKAAGLNPHLIAGQGNTGNAAAVGLPNAPQAAAAQGYTRAEAKNVMAGVNTFSDMAQMRNLAAQTDNARKLGIMYEQEAIRKAADTARINQNTAKGKFDLALAEELRQVSVEASIASLRKIIEEREALTLNNQFSRSTMSDRINTAFTTSQLSKYNAEFAKLSMPEKIKEIKAHVAQIKQDIIGKKEATENTIQQRDLLKVETRLKQLQKNMREQNIEIHDKWYWRALFGGSLFGEGINQSNYRHR